ncbi:MAG: DedA family protein [Verrucomicrobiales bacterium]|nr:DedA family protein [Verrucomicrobiales bacterium]
MAKHLPPWQVALAIALATLISEDVATIIAGILATSGQLSIPWAITGSLGGVLVGDFGLYALGYFGGMAILTRAPIRWWAKKEQIQQGSALLEQHGAKLIFSSRLIPGSRFPLYLSAGILRYPLLKYVIYMTIACTTSTFALLYLSMKLGSALLDYLKIYEKYALPVFITVALIIWLSVKLVEILATRRNRLRFLVRSRTWWRKLAGK